MILLKQSTSVIVSFGPFVDATDGVAYEIGLASAMADGTTGIRIGANGSDLGARTTSTVEYNAFGMYLVTLDATDTATLGVLRMTFGAPATCRQVTQDYLIVVANVWDSLFSTDKLQVDAAQFAGQTITAAAGVTLPASVASPTNITAGTITTVTNLTNAPTSGDLTATMKTSVTTAATAATPIVASVSGAVGSVTADVSITQAAANKVWDTTTRRLSDGTNIVLAKGVGVTGFNDIAATAVVSAGAITTSGGKVSGVILTDTLTTYTGNTPQTGDAYAQLAAISATTWTYTVTDSVTAAAIPDVDVWVTSDEAGTDVLASGRTNASGVVTFYLSPGTVYVFRAKSGYSFVNPDTETVS